MPDPLPTPNVREPIIFPDAARSLQRKDEIGGENDSLLQVHGDLTLAGTADIQDSGSFGVGSYRLYRLHGRAH